MVSAQLGEENNLECEEDMENLRYMLNKAIEMNDSKDEILKISQLLDTHIVKFLEKKPDTETEY